MGLYRLSSSAAGSGNWRDGGFELRNLAQQ